ASARAVQKQPMQFHLFRLKRLELDFRKPAFGDLAPAVDARFRLLSFAPVQAPQELAGVFARGYGANRRTRERFDGVAAQKLAPVMIEEVGGGENVAPGYFAAIGDNHSDYALAFQAGGRTGKAPLHFVDKVIDGDAHRAGLIDLFVRLRPAIVGDGTLNS